MVAVVTGADLGLFDTSLNVTGTRDSKLGLGNESFYVNAATGNLIVQRQDKVVAGHGLDASIVRTYNSQGELNSGHGNFIFSFQASLEILNVNGQQIIRRYSGDGDSADFRFDSDLGAYISTEGHGAHDSIVDIGENRFLWREGSTGIEETYEFENGKSVVISRTDREGFTTSFSYSSDKISVSDAGGQTIEVYYDSSTSLIERIVTLYPSTGTDPHQETSVYYTYENEKLTAVQVDLSPEDNSIEDGKTFRTEYEYFTGSNLIKSISQIDGAQGTGGEALVNKTEFGYLDGKIQWLKQGVGESARYTVFRYNAFQTEVLQVADEIVDETQLGSTLLSGNSTIYHYDDKGQLEAVETPANDDGIRPKTRYIYNNQGDLTSVIDSDNNASHYQVDEFGRTELIQNSLGSTIYRTFNSNNQILTETKYANADLNVEDDLNEASDPLTTNYIYDQNNRLRFVVSPEGRVQESEYGQAAATTDGNNERKITSIEYAAARYTGTTFTEAALESWAGAQVDTQRQVSESYLDFRGQLYKKTQFENGEGVPTGSTTEYFIYDSSGRLIKSVGAGSAQPLVDSLNSKTEIQQSMRPRETDYVYDGFGRLIATASASNEKNLINASIAGLESQANRFQEVTLYNAVSGNDGEVYVVTNIKAFSVDGEAQPITRGVAVHQFYNSAGALVRELAVDASDFLSGIDSELSAPSSLETGGLRENKFFYDTLGRLRMTLDSEGVRTHSLYDSRGNLWGSVDGNGALTEFTYNSKNQVVRKAEYYNYLSSAQLNLLVEKRIDDESQEIEWIIEEAPDLDKLRPSFHSNDRLTYSLYDDAGKLIFEIDGEGYVTEYVYDGANRKVQTIEHSTPYPIEQRFSDSEIAVQQKLTASDLLNQITMVAELQNPELGTLNLNAFEYLTREIFEDVSVVSVVTGEHIEAPPAGVNDYTGEISNFAHQVFEQDPLPTVWNQSFDGDNTDYRYGYVGRIGPDEVYFQVDQSTGLLKIQSTNVDGGYVEHAYLHGQRHYSREQSFTARYKIEEDGAHALTDSVWFGVSDELGNSFGVRFSSDMAFTDPAAGGSLWSPTEGITLPDIRTVDGIYWAEVEAIGDNLNIYFYDASEERPEVAQYVYDITHWGNVLHSAVDVTGSREQYTFLQEVEEQGLLLTSPEVSYWEQDFESGADENYGFVGYQIGEHAYNGKVPFFSTVEVEGDTQLHVAAADLTSGSLQAISLRGDRSYLNSGNTETLFRYEFIGGRNAADFHGFVGVTDQNDNQYGVYLRYNNVYVKDGIRGSTKDTLDGTRDLNATYVVEIEVSAQQVFIYYYKKGEPRSLKFTRNIAYFGNEISSLVQTQGSVTYDNYGFQIEKVAETGVLSGWDPSVEKTLATRSVAGHSIEGFFDLLHEDEETYLNVADTGLVITTTQNVATGKVYDSVTTDVQAYGYNGYLDIVEGQNLGDGDYFINVEVFNKQGEVVKSLTDKTFTVGEKTKYDQQLAWSPEIQTLSEGVTASIRYKNSIDLDVESNYTTQNITTNGEAHLTGLSNAEYDYVIEYYHLGVAIQSISGSFIAGDNLNHSAEHRFASETLTETAGVSFSDYIDPETLSDGESIKVEVIDVITDTIKAVAISTSDMLEASGGDLNLIKGTYLTPGVYRADVYRLDNQNVSTQIDNFNLVVSGVGDANVANSDTRLSWATPESIDALTKLQVRIDNLSGDSYSNLVLDIGDSNNPNASITTYLKPQNDHQYEHRNIEFRDSDFVDLPITEIFTWVEDFAEVEVGNNFGYTEAAYSNWKYGEFDVNSDSDVYSFNLPEETIGFAENSHQFTFTGNTENFIANLEGGIDIKPSGLANNEWQWLSANKTLTLEGNQKHRYEVDFKTGSSLQQNFIGFDAGLQSVGIHLSGNQISQWYGTLSNGQSIGSNTLSENVLELDNNTDYKIIFVVDTLSDDQFSISIQDSAGETVFSVAPINLNNVSSLEFVAGVKDTSSVPIGNALEINTLTHFGSLHDDLSLLLQVTEAGSTAEPISIDVSGGFSTEQITRIASGEVIDGSGYVFSKTQIEALLSTNTLYQFELTAIDSEGTVFQRAQWQANTDGNKLLSDTSSIELAKSSSATYEVPGTSIAGFFNKPEIETLEYAITRVYQAGKLVRETTTHASAVSDYRGYLNLAEREPLQAGRYQIEVDRFIRNELGSLVSEATLAFEYDVGVEKQSVTQTIKWRMNEDLDSGNLRVYYRPVGSKGSRDLALVQKNGDFYEVNIEGLYGQTVDLLFAEIGQDNTIHRASESLWTIGEDTGTVLIDAISFTDWMDLSQLSVEVNGSNIFSNASYWNRAAFNGHVALSNPSLSDVDSLSDFFVSDGTFDIEVTKNNASSPFISYGGNSLFQVGDIVQSAELNFDSASTNPDYTIEELVDGYLVNYIDPLTEKKVSLTVEKLITGNGNDLTLEEINSGEYAVGIQYLDANGLDDKHNAINFELNKEVAEVSEAALREFYGFTDSMELSHLNETPTMNRSFDYSDTATVEPGYYFLDEFEEGRVGRFEFVDKRTSAGVVNSVWDVWDGGQTVNRPAFTDSSIGPVPEDTDDHGTDTLLGYTRYVLLIDADVVIPEDAMESDSGTIQSVREYLENEVGLSESSYHYVERYFHNTTGARGTYNSNYNNTVPITNNVDDVLAAGEYQLLVWDLSATWGSIYAPVRQHKLQDQRLKLTIGDSNSTNQNVEVNFRFLNNDYSTDGLTGYVRYAEEDGNVDEYDSIGQATNGVFSTTMSLSSSTEKGFKLDIELRDGDKVVASIPYAPTYLANHRGNLQDDGDIGIKYEITPLVDVVLEEMKVNSDGLSINIGTDNIPESVNTNLYQIDIDEQLAGVNIQERSFYSARSSKWEGENRFSFAMPSHFQSDGSELQAFIRAELQDYSEGSRSVHEIQTSSSNVDTFYNEDDNTLTVSWSASANSPSSNVQLSKILSISITQSGQEVHDAITLEGAVLFDQSRVSSILASRSLSPIAYNGSKPSEIQAKLAEQSSNWDGRVLLVKEPNAALENGALSPDHHYIVWISGDGPGRYELYRPGQYTTTTTEYNNSLSFDTSLAPENSDLYLKIREENTLTWMPVHENDGILINDKFIVSLPLSHTTGSAQFLRDKTSYEFELIYYDRDTKKELMGTAGTFFVDYEVQSPSSVYLDVTRDIEGRITNHYYDDDGLLLQEVDHAGRVSAFEYDGAGQLVQTTLHAQQIEQKLLSELTYENLWGYTRDEEKFSRNNPEDIVSYSLYDGLGRKTASIDAGNYLTRMNYNERGLLDSTVRYHNAVSESQIDLEDIESLVEQVSGYGSDDRAETYDYFDDGLVSTLTTNQGLESSFVYDASSRLTSTQEVGLNQEGITSYQESERVQSSRYDLLGRLVEEQSPTGLRSFHEYNSSGLRIKTTVYITPPTSENETGEIAGLQKFFYDANGQMVFSLDGEGGLQETIYNALGQVSGTRNYANSLSQELVAGVEPGLASFNLLQYFRAQRSDLDTHVSMAYDRRGLISLQRDALGNLVSSQYDAFKQLRFETREVSGGELNGQKIIKENIFNRAGELESEIRDAGESGKKQTTSWGYDAFGRVNQLVDALGKSETYQYDKLGRQIQLTDKTSATYDTTYDAFGRILTKSGPNNLHTEFQYDQSTGAAITRQRVTDEGSQIRWITTETYSNRFGEQVVTVEPNGNRTLYIYNGEGQLLRTYRGVDENFDYSVYADPQTAPIADDTKHYNELGLLSREISSTGLVTDYVYDKANRLVQRIVDPSRPEESYEGDSLTTTYQYDGRGLKLRETNSENITTETQYDAKGQVVAIIVDVPPEEIAEEDLTRDYLQQTTTFSYDDEGRQLTVTTGGTYGFDYEFDLSGQQSLVANSGFSTTRYEYDTLGRRIKTIEDTSLVNPATGKIYYQGLDLTTTFHYDKNDRLLATENPAGQLTHFVYDSVGRERFSINAAGQVVETVYDERGLKVLSKQYEASFDLASFDSQHSIDESVIDELIDMAARPEGDRATHFVYDDAGRLRYEIDSEGRVVKHDFDLFLDASEDAAYQYKTSYQKTTTIAYDVSVPTRSIPYENQEQVELAISDAQASKTTNAETQYTHQYFDDRNRLIISINQQSVVTENIYDSLDRVVKRITYSNPYNGSHNISEMLTALHARENDSDRAVHFVYDHLDRLQYTVDPAGYVLESRYDNANRLIETIEYTDAISLTSNLDPIQTVTLGQVTAALGELSDDAKRVTATVYDGANRIIQTTDALGHSEYFEYDAAGNRILMTNKLGHTWRYFYDGANRLIEEVSPEVEVNYLDQIRWQTDFSDPNQDGVSGTLLDVAQHEPEGLIVYPNPVSGIDAGEWFSLEADSESVPDFNVYKSTFTTSESISDLEINIGVKGSNLAGEPRFIKARFSDQGVFALDYIDSGNSVQTKLRETSEEYIDEFGQPQTQEGSDYLQSNLVFNSNTQYTVELDFATRTQITRVNSENEFEIFTSAQVFIYETGASRTSGDIIELSESEIDWQNALGEELASTRLFTEIKAHPGAPQLTLNDFTYSRPSNQVSQIGENNELIASRESIKTRYEYDGIDNLIRKTEAAGTNVERTIRYGYNSLGEQTLIALPAFSVYDEANDYRIEDVNGEDTRLNLSNSNPTEMQVSPEVRIYFDAFGNAVANVDEVDAVSYKVYNSVNQVEYEIDGEGYVTEYEYDVFGNTSKIIRYQNRLSTGTHSNDLVIPGSADELHGFSGIDRSKLAERLLESDFRSGAQPLGRVLVHEYNSLNQLVAVIQPEAMAGVSDSTNTWLLADSLVTRYEYDAFGNVTRESQSTLVADPSGTLADQYWFYDAQNRVVGAVDALGYFTVTNYDGADFVDEIGSEEGNPVQKVEYARSLFSIDSNLPEQLSNGQVSFATLKGLAEQNRLTALNPGSNGEGFDRVTITYSDKLDRQIKAVTKGGLSHELTIVESGAGDPLQFAQSLEDQTTRTTYDAVGNITSETQANGATRFFYYDAIGNTIGVVEPSRLQEQLGASEHTPISLLEAGTSNARLSWERPDIAGLSITLELLSNYEYQDNILQNVENIWQNATVIDVGFNQSLYTLQAEVGDLFSDQYQYRISYRRIGEEGLAPVATVEGHVGIVTDKVDLNNDNGELVYFVEENSSTQNTLHIQGKLSTSTALVVYREDTGEQIHSSNHSTSGSSGLQIDLTQFDRGNYTFTVNGTELKGRFTVAYGDIGSAFSVQDKSVVVDVVEILERQEYLRGDYKYRWRKRNTVSLDFSSFAYLTNQPTATILTRTGTILNEGELSGTRSLIPSATADKFFYKISMELANTKGDTGIYSYYGGVNEGDDLSNVIFSVKSNASRDENDKVRLIRVTAIELFQMQSVDGDQMEKAVFYDSSVGNHEKRLELLNLKDSELQGEKAFFRYRAQGSGAQFETQQLDRIKTDLYATGYSMPKGPYEYEIVTQSGSTIRKGSMIIGSGVHSIPNTITSNRLQAKTIELSVDESKANGFAVSQYQHLADRESIQITGLSALESDLVSLFYRSDENEAWQELEASAVIDDGVLAYWEIEIKDGVNTDKASGLAKELASGHYQIEIKVNDGSGWPAAGYQGDMVVGYNGSSVISPLTTFAHDALGNQITTTRHANGALSANLAGFIAATASSESDQVIRSRFNKGGYRVEELNGEGHVTRFSYDAKGRVRKEWVEVEDDRPNRIDQVVGNVYRYNKVGQKIETIMLEDYLWEWDQEAYLNNDGSFTDGYSLSSHIHHVAEYNAFGEVTATAVLSANGEAEAYNTWLAKDKHLADGESIYYDYNDMGQVIRHNENGYGKLFVYNVQGYLQKEISSATLGEIDGLDLATEYDVVATDIGYKENRYITDALGRATHRYSDRGDFINDHELEVQQVYDRWGNVIRETHEEGTTDNVIWVTTEYRYDQQNRLIEEILPEYDYYSEKGVKTTGSTLKRVYYDNLGRELGSQAGYLDGATFVALNSSANIYDGAGQLVRELVDVRSNINDTDLVEAQRIMQHSYTYDALGRQTEIKDGKGSAQYSVYDRNDRLTARYYSDGGESLYRYDAAGRKIEEKQLVEVIGGVHNYLETYYYHDQRGNVTDKTVGASTGRLINLGMRREHFEYDRYGNQIGHALGETLHALSSTDFLNGRDLDKFWVYDMFGRETLRSDWGDIRFESSYNGMGNLTSVIQQDDRGVAENDGSTNRTYMQYSYFDDGLLKSVQDLGNYYLYNQISSTVAINEDAGHVTRYEYDIMGRKVREHETVEEQGLATARTDATTTYDVLGRMIQLESNWTGEDGYGVNLHYLYDAAGNRRAVLDNQLVLDGATTGDGYTALWYDYDKANRVTLSQGQLASQGSDITLASENDRGAKIFYDSNGNRAGVERRYKKGDNPWNSLKEKYEFDSMNRHINTRISGEDFTDGSFISQKFYDLTGRVLLDAVYNIEHDAEDIENPATLDNLSEFNLYGYNNDGTQHTHIVANNVSTILPAFADRELSTAQLNTLNTKQSTFHYLAEFFGMFKVDKLATESITEFSYDDLTGSMTGYISNYIKDREESHEYHPNDFTYDYTYFRYDSFLVDSIEGRATGNHRLPGSTIHEYDANGNLTTIRDEEATLATHFDGESTIGNLEEDSVNIDKQKERNFDLNIDGQIIRTSYSKAETENSATLHHYRRYNYFSSGKQVASNGSRQAEGYQDRQWVIDGNGQGHYEYFWTGSGDSESRFGGWESQTEFDDYDLNYKPISSRNSQAAPSHYTVSKADESLENIALSVWGDASLWYVIAEANGLSGKDGLTRGQSLIIPNSVVVSQNNSQTFQPYNPVDMLGSSTPTFGEPPIPASSNGCTGAQMIVGAIVTVVMIVMAVYTNGASLKTGAKMMLAMATAAAAQGIYQAAGMQDGFNLRQIVAAGITAGLSNGLGEALQGIEALEGANLAMAQAASQFVMNHAVNKLTGQDVHFEWSGVLASVSAAAVTHYALGSRTAVDIAERAKLPLKERMVNSFTDSFVGGAIEQTTERLFNKGGQQRLDMVYADAFGNMLGTALIDVTAPKPASVSLDKEVAFVQAAIASLDTKFGSSSKDDGGLFVGPSVDSQFSMTADADVPSVLLGRMESSASERLNASSSETLTLIGAESTSVQLEEPLPSMFTGEEYMLAQGATTAPSPGVGPLAPAAAVYPHAQKVAEIISEEITGQQHVPLGQTVWELGEDLWNMSLDNFMTNLATLNGFLMIGHSSGGSSTALPIVDPVDSSTSLPLVDTSSELGVPGFDMSDDTGAVQLINPGTPQLPTRIEGSSIVESGPSGYYSVGGGNRSKDLGEADRLLGDFYKHSLAQKTDFYDGKVVVAGNPINEPLTTILQKDGDVLRAGIFNIYAPDDPKLAVKLFKGFKDNSELLARSLGVSKVEFLGAEVQNPEVMKFLTRQGFKPGAPITIEYEGLKYDAPTVRKTIELKLK